METKVMQGKHLIIQGHVQGVSYRYFMRAAATAFNVTGWCRNLPDGSVEGEIWGTPEALRQMLAWCNQGSPMSRVRRVECSDLPSESPDSLPETFEIRR